MYSQLPESSAQTPKDVDKLIVLCLWHTLHALVLYQTGRCSKADDRPVTDYMVFILCSALRPAASPQFRSSIHTQHGTDRLHSSGVSPRSTRHGLGQQTAQARKYTLFQAVALAAISHAIIRRPLCIRVGAPDCVLA